jgi:hypothetical protein
VSWIFPSLGDYEVDAIINGVVTRVEAFSTEAGKYDHMDWLKYAGRGVHKSATLNGRPMSPPRGEFHFWKRK